MGKIKYLLKIIYQNSMNMSSGESNPITTTTFLYNSSITLVFLWFYLRLIF
jgi:hypothetical protein